MIATNSTIRLNSGNVVLLMLFELSNARASGLKRFTLRSTRSFPGAKAKGFLSTVPPVRSTYRSCYNSAMGKPRSNFSSTGRAEARR